LDSNLQLGIGQSDQNKCVEGPHSVEIEHVTTGFILLIKRNHLPFSFGLQLHLPLHIYPNVYNSLPTEPSNQVDRSSHRWRQVHSECDFQTVWPNKYSRKLVCLNSTGKRSIQTIWSTIIFLLSTFKSDDHHLTLVNIIFFHCY